MKDVLILGSRGRLGAALLRVWAAQGIARPDLDVAIPEDLRDFLRSRTCRVLVNCTGATSLEQCEDDPEMAEAVNARAPAIMAAEAARAGARLVHFSTDYVFDGLLGRPYVEEDEPKPLGVYGRTKLAGERAVLAAGDRHMVVRVSWVFGPDKPGFVDMILRRALGGGAVEAVSDKTACPTYTEDVARWLAPCLGDEVPGGLYHACNAGACSWQEYGQGALDAAAALGWPLKARTVTPIPISSMAAFRAPRPPHTALSTHKLEKATGIDFRPWREALGACLAAQPVPA